LSGRPSNDQSNAFAERRLWNASGDALILVVRLEKHVVHPSTLMLHNLNSNVL
jgi:hypothetical protein